MQGYILHVNRVKDEDMIVFVLTPNRLKTTYRFYGARHSQVHIGYKIDFVALSSIKSSLLQLKDLLHIPFKWNSNRHRMMIWQNFCKLLFLHLKDVEELDSFYFELFDWCATRLSKQNPKRVIVEAYIKLLSHEGRLHKEQKCFLCDKIIEGKVGLGRAFLPAHSKCLSVEGFEKEVILELFENGSTLHVDDESVARLYKVVEEGI